MVFFKKVLSISVVITIFSLFFVVNVFAQDIGSVDFESLKSSDLSDQQVERLWERAQDQGYSVSELEQMAIARGMAPSEVSKLVRRVRSLRMQGGGEDSDPQSDQMRTVSDDSNFRMSPDSLKQDTLDRRIFGADLFRRDKVTFTPSLNIPTPEDYQLGPGDQLVIDIWGAAEQTYEVTVSNEGTISIANIGPIYVNGMEMDKARERIKSSLAQIYSGLEAEGDEPTDTQARISLGNVRSINVTVLGETRFPGTYSVPSLATVFNALYSAGGPDSTGTFRKIEVIRGDSVAATLDIYDFLVYGSQKDNIRLRDQDIIKIDPYISRVEMEGRTKRNGIFELEDGETVQNLITFAGGFSSDAYSERLKVVGNTGSQKQINDIRFPDEKNFKLQDGDSVHVGKVLDRFANKIEIEGAVFREGDYELKDSTTVSSLIERAEGIREDAFMNRGLIYREKDDLSTEVVSFNLRDLLNDPEKHDIELQRNDIVRISSIFDLQDDYTISVVGAVQDPGTFEYADNMTLEDVILQADGFRESAAPYRIEVSRRITDGDSAYVPKETADIHRFKVDEDLELDEDIANFRLKPFDRVYIRNAPSYVEQQQVEIKGEVLFPGEYTLDEQDMRISDLIQRAGGLTEYAYPAGGNLTREMDQNVDTAYINIPDTVESSEGLEQQTTKVGIQMDKIINNPGSEEDLILEEGDVLEVPKELQTVQISGEVLYPVSVRYRDNLSLKDYLRAAGGASDEGKPKDAYIVYANGEVDRASKFLFFRNYPDVRPGATIYVPRKEQERDLTPQERISIYSTIVSMAAIVTNTIFQVRRN